MKSKATFLMVLILMAVACERSTPPQRVKNVVLNIQSHKVSGDDACTRLSAETNMIPLEEDAKLPLRDQIQKSGYTSFDSEITEQNFKLRATGRRDVVLYDLKGNLSSEQVVRCMKDDGNVPATIDEAVAFGMQSSQQPLGHVVIFLGTAWPSSGRLFVPALGYYTGGARNLLLLSFDVSWDTTCRFAAVRQSSSP
jgi:hypothetical protein